MNMIYDVIVIGNGPAGISSAIYVKRNNLNVLVVSKQQSNLLLADKIENYYGFENPISGKELYNQGLNQAKNLNIPLVDEEVVDVTFMGNYEVTTSANKYVAKAVIVSTGANRVAPKIKGLKEFEGRGVSYCAVCDGFFYRKKDVAVLGNKEYALHELNVLKQFANSVTLLTNGLEYNLDELVDLEQRKIKEIRGNEVVEEIVFEDDSSLKVSGLFVAVGVASSLDFARKLGAEIQNNKLVVNELMQTNLPGLYACGDAVKGTPQIAKAVYEGMIAGMDASKYVRNIK
jgi:thioredoxin reductase (NADPH)